MPKVQLHLGIHELFLQFMSLTEEDPSGQQVQEVSFPLPGYSIATSIDNATQTFHFNITLAGHVNVSYSRVQLSLSHN